MFKLINTIKSNKGLTLIEMLVAISVGAIGMLGSYSLLAGVKGTLMENTAAVEAQQDARNIVQRIAREIRESSPKTVTLYSWTSEDGTASDTIFFYTPRDVDRKFIVDGAGEPEWQREISYGLDSYAHCLYRFQYYMSPDEVYPYEWEIVSNNVEALNFSRDNDMIIIKIKTFANDDNGIGHTAKSYADFHTMVKMRN